MRGSRKSAVCIQVSLSLYEGEGCTADENKAKELFERAAQTECDGYALYELGFIYERKNESPRKISSGRHSATRRRSRWEMRVLHGGFPILRRDCLGAGRSRIKGEFFLRCAIKYDRILTKVSRGFRNFAGELQNHTEHLHGRKFDSGILCKDGDDGGKIKRG